MKTNTIRNDIQRESGQDVVAYRPKLCFCDTNAEGPDIFQGMPKKMGAIHTGWKGTNTVQIMYQEYKNHRIF